MANTFTASRLASGQLPNSAAALYTVGPNKTSYVKLLIVTNTSNTLTESINIYVNDGTANRSIASSPLNLLPGQTCRVIGINEALNLNTGDAIWGNTTDASTVDYIITGIEEV